MLECQQRQSVIISEWVLLDKPNNPYNVDPPTEKGYEGGLLHYLTRQELLSQRLVLANLTLPHSLDQFLG